MYAPFAVAERPSRLVTVTFTLPLAPAGVTPVIEVALATVTAVARAPPNVMVAPAAKSVPVSVTAVPPVVGPVVGDTPVRVGIGP